MYKIYQIILILKILVIIDLITFVTNFNKFVSNYQITFSFMKNSANCPKCQSQNIIEIPNKAGKIGKWNNTVIWTGLKHVDVTKYLCGTCGFSEEWVENEEDIKKIFERYN